MIKDFQIAITFFGIVMTDWMDKNQANSPYVV